MVIFWSDFSFAEFEEASNGSVSGNCGLSIELILPNSLMNQETGVASAVKAFLISSSITNIEIEKPFIFKEVINCEGPTINFTRSTSSDF